MLKKTKKTKYLLFCDRCGVPKEIPIHILHAYIALGMIDGVYCDNCNNLIYLSDYLQKIAGEL